MTRITRKLPSLLKAGIAVALGTGATVATATEPCDDFGESKALIEINSSDGDIGFHFLMDLVADGVLPVRPEAVEVDAWEVVLEPDLENSDPLGNLKFTVRVAGG